MPHNNVYIQARVTISIEALKLFEALNLFESLVPKTKSMVFCLILTSKHSPGSIKCILMLLTQFPKVNNYIGQ